MARLVTSLRRSLSVKISNLPVGRARQHWFPPSVPPVPCPVPSREFLRGRRRRARLNRKAPGFMTRVLCLRGRLERGGKGRDTAKAALPSRNKPWLR